MATAGRKPKPPQLKLVTGNPGKRPIPDVVKPRPVAPTCPAFLSTAAKAEWKRVTPELERLGLLTIVDMAALAGYCESWANFKIATDALNAIGKTRKSRIAYMTDKGNLVVRPELQAQRAALQEIRAFCAEFGLTPSARGRLALPDLPAGGDDGLD